MENAGSFVCLCVDKDKKAGNCYMEKWCNGDYL